MPIVPRMKKPWIVLAAVALLALPAAAGARDGKRQDAKNAARYCKQLRTKIGVEAFREALGGGANAFGKCVKQRVHELKAVRKAARQACKQELAGKSKKVHLHGKRGKGAAFKKCVRKKTRAETEKDDEHTLAAVEQCKAEQAADPVVFEAEYATDDPGRTAFEECVSIHSEDDEGTDEPGDEGTEDPDESVEPEPDPGEPESE
jgi:hypothetical protein